MTSTLLKLITLSTFLGKSTVLLFLNVVKYIVFISLSCIKWRCIDGVIPSKAFAPTTSYFPFNHSMFVHSVSKPHNVECQAGGQFHLTLPSAGLTQVKLLPVYRGVIFQRVSDVCWRKYCRTSIYEIAKRFNFRVGMLSYCKCVSTFQM